MNAELASLLTSRSYWSTVLLVSLIPYAMFLVAYVFESRNVFRGEVAFWKGQSRAFVPGDLGLSILVATCLQYYGQVPNSMTKSWLLIFGSLVMGGVFFALGRGFFYTQKQYGQAWNSPTKRYHDFVMYWLFGAAAIYICMPTYIFVSWSDHWPVHVFGLGAALLLWGGGMIYDFTPAGLKQIDPKRQHPDVWRPIWRKLRRIIPSR